ncbi:MAG: hypothetical protein OHK0046_18950 [Anaerolineae bacterium]
MFEAQTAFSGFSVDDLARARVFYEEILGLTIDPENNGLWLHLPGGTRVFAYQKDNHQPATFTVLNFEAESIDAAVDALRSKGVQFERYPGLDADEKGIVRGLGSNQGPDIAWFTDPAGNIFSVIQTP